MSLRTSLALQFLQGSALLLALFGTFQSGLALDSFSLKVGTGVAVQTDGNYSPLAAVQMNSGRWGFEANVSGYSESQTKVTHLLTGAVYGIPLDSSERFKAEFGLGALMAQTIAEKKTENMVSLSLPIGLNWSIFKGTGFSLDANWKSWIFSSSPYPIPLLALLSHDRFTTLTLSAGVAL